MSPINYRQFHGIPVLQSYEIKHLRETLGWSQARMGKFLGRDGGTISRWETGHEPDELAAAALFGVWEDVFGPYEGPYPVTYSQPPAKSDDLLKQLGQMLLVGGAAFFIAKGLSGLLDPEDE